jgi:hypothetical protein
MAMTSFKALFQNLPRMEENHDNPHSGYKVSGPIFKLGYVKPSCPICTCQFRVEKL